VKTRLALFIAFYCAVFLYAYWRWPKTAELRLSATTQPREEVVVSGRVKNHKAAAFSLETLLIEEPGKEAYRRPISLDGERRFELALGKPVAGTYRVSVQTRKATLLSGVQEGWLQTPPLIWQSGGAAPKFVTASDADYQPLMLLGALGAVGFIVMLSRSRRVGFAHHTSDEIAEGGHSPPYENSRAKS
jgi:hypothetical protein